MLLISFFGVSALFVTIEFIGFLVKGKRYLPNSVFRTAELSTIVLAPILFLIGFDIDYINDCCGLTAFFSPEHRISIYILILICVVGYYHSSLRTKLSTPLLEVIINCFLLIALVLNIFIVIHINEDDIPLALLGSLPICLLFIRALIKNHRLFISDTEAIKPEKLAEKIIWKILRAKVFIKFPVLMIICIPILICISAFLLIFGQKPDSFVKAFTETYEHGLSQLDCTNIPCPDGHFLCTIAASGHQKLVKPLRMGIRHGYTIKVNRQLLVSNAFEELLQERFPAIHKIIRRIYNYVGGNFRKLYDILGNKWMADIIYLVMKPLEVLFFLVLYLFDRKPENRIMSQYFHPDDRKKIQLG